jgi:hypothetical protein
MNHESILFQMWMNVTPCSPVEMEEPARTLTARTCVSVRRAGLTQIVRQVRAGSQLCVVQQENKYLVLLTVSIFISDVDECLRNPCMYNGTCLNTRGSYMCTCPRERTGKNCMDGEFRILERNLAIKIYTRGLVISILTFPLNISILWSSKLLWLLNLMFFFLQKNKILFVCKLIDIRQL